MGRLATGIDLVEVARLETLQENIRRKFVGRVFTPRERDWAGESSARLAMLFAAKEAVAKALGSGIGEISWQDIEVVFNNEDDPQLQLSGTARQVGASQGLDHWKVSISHTSRYALAFVVAWVQE